MTVVPPDAMVGGLPETGSSRRIRGAYHAFTVTARSPNELAVRAGVPAAFVERLVDLGIVAAADDGTFSDQTCTRFGSFGHPMSADCRSKRSPVRSGNVASHSPSWTAPTTGGPPSGRRVLRPYRQSCSPPCRSRRTGADTRGFRRRPARWEAGRRGLPETRGGLPEERGVASRGLRGLANLSQRSELARDPPSQEAASGSSRSTATRRSEPSSANPTCSEV
jgi:hypothetical protein